MKRFLSIFAVLLALPLAANAQEVKITKDMLSATVETDSGPVEITRNQDTNATIEADFAKTSRKCPPFCVQPMVPAAGVMPVGELEVIDFVTNRKGVLVDARTTDWHLKGTIPGSVNIPYTEIVDRLDELGCTNSGAAWDCAAAMPTVLYCNGPWCGQSPTAIHAMIGAGFPADKILYYRGGVQDWKILGLTMVEGSL